MKRVKQLEKWNDNRESNEMVSIGDHWVCFNSIAEDPCPRTGPRGPRTGPRTGVLGNGKRSHYEYSKIPYNFLKSIRDAL